MDGPQHKKIFSKSDPRSIVDSRRYKSQGGDNSSGISSSPGKYISIPPIFTQCIVVKIVNAVNIDVILNLTEEQKRLYSTVITNPISYTVTDPVTLKDREIVHTVAYRARLGGIAVPGKTINQSQLKKKLMNIATTQLRCYLMRTNGLFKCKISDIDVYHRILIELFDPITGKSLNDHILKKFHPIMSPYNVNSIGDKPRNSHTSYQSNGNHRKRLSFGHSTQDSSEVTSMFENMSHYGSAPHSYLSLPSYNSKITFDIEDEDTVDSDFESQHAEILQVYSQTI